MKDLASMTDGYTATVVAILDGQKSLADRVLNDIGELRRDLKNDVGKIYKRIDEDGREGCGFAKVLESKVNTNRIYISELKDQPDKQMSRVGVLVSVIAGIVSVLGALYAFMTVGKP